MTPPLFFVSSGQVQVSCDLRDDTARISLADDHSAPVPLGVVLAMAADIIGDDSLMRRVSESRHGAFCLKVEPGWQERPDALASLSEDPWTPQTAPIRDLQAVAGKLLDGVGFGSFSSFSDWVNKAQSRIGGTGALCFDAKGRRCRMGADFHRARDEEAFPVVYYIFPGWSTEQKRSSG